MELDLFNSSNDVKELDFDIPMSNKIETYYEKVEPTLSKRQEQVLFTIAEMARPVTMHEVAKEMRVELNTISGRFGELIKKNKLIVTGKTPDNKSLYKTT